jgi:hypothetical protein
MNHPPPRPNWSPACPTCLSAGVGTTSGSRLAGRHQSAGMPRTPDARRHRRRIPNSRSVWSAPACRRFPPATTDPAAAPDRSPKRQQAARSRRFATSALPSHLAQRLECGASRRSRSQLSFHNVRIAPPPRPLFLHKL